MGKKTPGDAYLHKTGKKKTKILMALILLSAFILSTAVPAKAQHAHSIVTFTDKKTYMGWWVDPNQKGTGYSYAGVDTAPLDIYVYAMVLTEQGTIIKGEESQLNGYVADYKRLTPGQASGHHIEYFGENIFGNKTLTFTDDGSLSGDIPGDGIYVAKVNLDKTRGASLVGDHMVMNVSVSYPGMTTTTEQVLISGFYCMSGVRSGSGHAQHTSQTGDSANCAVCHHGYEHWYENVSKTFRDDQLDIHIFKVNPLDVPLADQTTPFEGNRWNWSDDGGGTSFPTFEDQVKGSKYCAFCHEVLGSATYDYGGGDRSNMSDRPSCNNSNCHSTTEISNTTVPAWQPAAMSGDASTTTRVAYNISKAEKHAHDSTGVDTVPCVSCHRTTHSLELPNRTSTDYTDLSGRCLSCHTLFNKHNDTVSCVKCHTNDTHNIRFLQQDLSYNWSTTNIVTCDNCHSNQTYPGVLGLSPPQVPYTNHSGDNNAGQKWGDYWTSDNQQTAAGGSNLIKSSTVVVSSESAQYGTTSQFSQAWTVNDLFETLTEGMRSVAPRDDYTYVDSNITSLGTIINWNNIKNASDGNATANFTEAIPSSRNPAIVNGNFTVDNSSWTETLVQTAGDNVPFDYRVFNTGSPQFNASRAYLQGRSDTGEGNITQTFDISDVDLRRKINLTFKFRKFASVGPTTAHTLNVRLVRPNGTVAYTFSNTTTQSVGTGPWMTQNLNVTPNITVSGIWTLEVYNLISVPNSANAEGATDVDDVNITFPTPYSYGLVAENSIPNVPQADNYYLEMNYKVQGDTYSVYLYNGSAWNSRATLNSTILAKLNYTMQTDEYNGGSPVVKILDRNASTTTQGNISIDYMRIHGWTGDTSHQEINLNHNFTGVPKYAAQETADYTLTIKGNVTTSENLDIYYFDYGSGSYQLARLNAFSTTNNWVNYSLPYSAISVNENASIQFRDSNRTRYDTATNTFSLDYVAIKADSYKYLPCFYCHALLANHKKKALGNVGNIQNGPGGTNPKNNSNFSGYWCANCHYNGSTPFGSYKYNGSAWSPAPPLIETNNVQNNSGSWVDHVGSVSSNFTDAKCKECHGTSKTNTTKDFPHTVEIGTSGGPNCTQCHNIGGSAGSGRLVNFTAMSDSLSIHKNLNSGASSPSGYSSDNFKCWACHGNGSEPASGGHPTPEYNNPRSCDSCHINNSVPYGALQVKEHYWSGTSINTPAATTCYICHNRSEMMLGLTLDPDGPASIGGANAGNNSTSHYGKRRTDYPSQGTDSYCNQCHNNISAPSVFPFVNNGNATIANHSTNYPASNPGCNSCHSTQPGRIHNSTIYKPALILPNTTYCLTCHGTPGNSSTTIKNLQQHNGTTGVNCTRCHLNSTKSIHPVRYLQQDGSTWSQVKNNPVNCSSCHQGSGISNFTTARRVPTPMNHSTNPYSGALWNNSQPAYWTNTSQQSSCDYCHGKNALHNTSGLGNITKVNRSSSVRQDFDTGQWCANCHYKNAPGYAGNTFNPEPPEILNLSGKVPLFASDGTAFYNHSQDVAAGFNDSKCKNCHNNNLDAGATSLNFTHNLGQGGGGPNCTACHYIGAAAQNVNVSVMKNQNSIHYGLNKDASSTDSGFNDSKNCWACHQSDGTQPQGHPDRKINPYNCTDCHVQGSGQNLNYTPSTILIVAQHYNNGTNIKTPAASTCYACHNVSGMILSANDPDGASSNIYGGSNGGNYSVSHYGIKRGDMAIQQNTTPYCDNCHNSSSAFPFINEANRSISNHSTGYPASNPTCRDCHFGGRIHNSTLYKATLGQTNSTYCTSCHGSPGNASTTIKNLQQHNGSTGVNCTQCHLNTSKSIHPVRYLQQDGSTWSQAKNNPVNCSSCHQGSGLLNFSSARKVPAPMNHSTNTYSGALWNGSQPAFWINTSQQSSCDYCHGKLSLHNLSGLGNITKVKGSNNVRQSITGGYWCANCHYKNAPGYGGAALDPQPPEILNLSSLVPAFARDNTQFYNHSDDLSTFDDEKCKSCHDNNLGGTATSLNFTHNLGSGGGGPNCTSCHGLGGSLADGKRINQTAMNSSTGIHKDLNKDATASDVNYSDSKKCWACHGDGTEPGGHPANYKTPFNCTSCHVQGAGQNFNYQPNNTIMNVSQHYWNGTSINTSAATSCYICHNKSEMMLGMNLDPDGSSTNIYSGSNGGNNSSSHYGRKRTDYPVQDTIAYCNKCHNNGTSVFPFIDQGNKTIANHSMNYAATNPSCLDSRCHATGRLHNDTLYKPAFNISNRTYCLNCHGNNGTGGTNYSGAVTTYKENHNGSMCANCHMNSTSNVHPMRYLRLNNTWSTTNSSPVNCTSCHQGTGFPNFSTAPLVKTPIWHSNNTYSGALWNGSQPRFWDNKSQQSNCDYCHGNISLHNNSGLGKSAIVQAGNSKNQSLTGSFWCANCHFKGDPPTGLYIYMGESFYPVPPEIFNLTGLVSAASSSGMLFQNHSTNIAGDKSDARCKTCHGKDLPAGTRSGEFMHKLNESAPETGGPDCLKCHSSTANASESQGTPTDKRVNKTAFTNYSVHRDMNSGASSTLDAAGNMSKPCWACHGDGNQTIKHPATYTNPKTCDYCHTNNNFNAPQVYSHYPGARIGNRTYDNFNYNRTCASCHNNSIVNNLNISLNPDMLKRTNSSASHYSVNRTMGNYLGYPAVTDILPNSSNVNLYGCNECHKVGIAGGYYGQLYGNARSLPSGHNDMGSSSYPCEKSCHNNALDAGGDSAAVTLHNTSISIYVGTFSCYSLGCHTPPPPPPPIRR